MNREKNYAVNLSPYVLLMIGTMILAFWVSATWFSAYESGSQTLLIICGSIGFWLGVKEYRARFHAKK